MNVIVKNGQRKIEFSVADQRATATVVQNLKSLRDHAGGEVAVAAEKTLDALEGFMSLLATEDVVWAEPRKAAPATA